MARVWKNPRVLFGVAGVAALVAVAMWPRAVPVDTAVVRRGSIEVTLDEDGQTRVRNRFVVAAPVAGEVRRISLQPGDRVTRGADIAVLRPAVTPPLDARTRAEATAALEAAQAAVGRLTTEMGRARTARDRAAQQVARALNLAKAGALAREELEARQTELYLADATVRAAEFARAQAEHEVSAARARLAPAGQTTGADVHVVAPVTGIVLRRHRESQSVVPAGEPLVEIGDPTAIEIVADFLSADAVRIRPGQAVRIEQWGGDPLRGRVRLVEPSGFTRVSALGVEEQRVNVLIDFQEPPDAIAAIRDNFRVEVRVIVAERAQVLTVPLGSLFRRQDAWAVYTVVDGKAALRAVEIGARSRTDAEVVSGLEEGSVVVLYPPDTLSDGVKVEVRGGR
jgi:HlyD family secretion protein